MDRSLINGPYKPQIPATQPLLILATCQRRPEELPPVLLTFFQPDSPAATSAHHSPSQHLNNQAFTNGTDSPKVTSTKLASNLWSSQVIVMESGAEAASAGSWQEAANRSAEAAAHAVAAAAVFSFQQKLLDLAPAVSNQEVSHGAASRVSKNPSSNTARTGQSLEGPSVEADGADGMVACEGHSLGHCGSGAGVRAHPKEGASRGAKAVNENELQQGLELHAEVGLWQVAEVCGRKGNPTTQQKGTEKKRKERKTGKNQNKLSS